jgi:hypothetical protein
MGIVAFLLESPHGPRPLTIRERMHSGDCFEQFSYAPAGDPESDREIGRRYARLGAGRVLTEAANGGNKFERRQRVADWRALFIIQAGDSYRHILDMGMSTRERLLAAIRNRDIRLAQAAEAERARCDRAFFGLDVIEVIHKRPRLALSR